MTAFPIRVGESACLLGDEVRWDGDARLHPWLRDILGRYLELVPICPEVEVGMGVPREPVDLVRVGGRDQMIARSGRNWTAEMERFAAKRIAALPPLDGYVWKARSPSCGLGSTPLRRGSGAPAARTTSGLFAAAFAAARPLTPLAEETDLVEPAARGHFIERVFASARLRELLAGRASSRRLVEFHTAEKYRLLAHSPARLRALGRIVATAASVPPAELRDAYAAAFAAALATPMTPGRLVDALTHASGHLKRILSSREREVVAETIDAHGRGEAPLVEALSVLRHLVRVHGEPHLAAQTLLFPDPREWMLRFGV